MLALSISNLNLHQSRLPFSCSSGSFTVIHQRYDLEVQNPGGFIGSNVIIKCNIPQFVKEYVKVTSWLEEPMHNIYPSSEGGEFRV